MSKISNNITVAYIIGFAKYAWFWLGIWVLYYLKFTDYRGIGLIETIMITTKICGEIPTGAIGDLLGKKKTLFLALFIEGFCDIWMGFTNTFPMLIVCIFVLTIGATFYSGSFEAFIYDTLKSSSEEKLYDRIYSKAVFFGLIATVLAGIVGGFLYKFNNSLPYFLTGIIQISASISLVFAKEPFVDSKKYKFSDFFTQNIKGLTQLLKKINLKTTFILLLTTSIPLIFYEGMDSYLAIDFGANPALLGAFFSLVALVSAITLKFASNLFIQGKNSYRNLIVLTFIYSISLIISPYLTLILGLSTIVLRNIIDPITNILVSSSLNARINSKDRATTLSTFSALKSIPYAFTSIGIGSIIDNSSARTVSLYLGLLMLLFIIFSYIINNLNFLSSTKKNE